MHKLNKRFTPVGILLSVILFIVINVYSNKSLKKWRLDLTQNKIYTLSDGTKKILANLQEPITLRFYFSKKLAKDNPYLLSMSARLEETLKQYQRLQSAKLKLEIIDPEPFSEEEDRAVNFGLQGAPVDADGRELYFGLVGTNSTLKKEIIPFLQPNKESTFEYDVTKLIYNLANPEPKKIAILSSLPIAGAQDYQQLLIGNRSQTEPWAIWEQMAEQFNIEELEANPKQIPAAIKALILINPQNLSEDTLYAIDQFVIKGGHVLLFLDPHSEVANSKALPFANQEQTPILHKLLQAWGVNFNNKQVVALQERGKNVRYHSENKELALRYPLWMDLIASDFNKHDILTGNLERLTLATPGYISPIESASTNFVPLVQTTTDAMIIDADKLETYKTNPLALQTEYKPSGKRYVLAARISGPIASAYPNGYNNNLNHQEKNTNSNIIIIADSDMLHNHFWINIQSLFGHKYGVANSGNGNFVLSAIENLCGNNDLINIRNRENLARPFTKVMELELQSRAKYQATEQALLQKVDAAKQKLALLEKQKQQENTLLINIQQKQEEDLLREELVAARKQLREVRRDLNREIKYLEETIKFFGILFIPLIITTGSLISWGSKLSRRKEITI